MSCFSIVQQKQNDSFSMRAQMTEEFAVRCSYYFAKADKCFPTCCTHTLMVGLVRKAYGENLGVGASFVRRAYTHKLVMHIYSYNSPAESASVKYDSYKVYVRVEYIRRIFHYSPIFGA